MQEMMKKIQSTIEQIDSIYVLLCENKSEEAIKEIGDILPELNQIVTRLISEIPYYRQLGVDLPEDVILAQLNNLLESYEQKDVVMLADTLEYELKDTLQVYEEILEQLETQQ